jgi:hypothetical protein
MFMRGCKLSPVGRVENTCRQRKYMPVTKNKFKWALLASADLNGTAPHALAEAKERTAGVSSSSSSSSRIIRFRLMEQKSWRKR